MTVNLTIEQMAWLKRIAAERGIATLDEAAQAVIAEAMLQSEELDLDNLDWVKPLLDEAREDIRQGRTVSHQEIKEYLKMRIEGFDRS